MREIGIAISTETARCLAIRLPQRSGHPALPPLDLAVCGLPDAAAYLQQAWLLTCHRTLVSGRRARRTFGGLTPAADWVAARRPGWTRLPPARLGALRSAMCGGYVEDAAGDPVVGASMTLQPYDLKVTTEDAGYFLIPDVYLGTYAITVEATGLTTLNTSVELNATTSPVTFNMP